MRIEFAPPPAPPPPPKTSWLSVFALAFIMVWAAMLGFVMGAGPGRPPIERLVFTVAQHWRQTTEQTQPQETPQTQQGMTPTRRASIKSRAPSAAILGARPGY